MQGKRYFPHFLAVPNFTFNSWSAVIISVTISPAARLQVLKTDCGTVVLSLEEVEEVITKLLNRLSGEFRETKEENGAPQDLQFLSITR